MSQSNLVVLTVERVVICQTCLPLVSNLNCFWLSFKMHVRNWARGGGEKICNTGMQFVVKFSHTSIETQASLHKNVPIGRLCQAMNYNQCQLSLDFHFWQYPHMATIFIVKIREKRCQINYGIVVMQLKYLIQVEGSSCLHLGWFRLGPEPS